MIESNLEKPSEIICVLVDFCTPFFYTISLKKQKNGGFLVGHGHLVRCEAFIRISRQRQDQDEFVTLAPRGMLSQTGLRHPTEFWVDDNIHPRADSRFPLMFSPILWIQIRTEKMCCRSIIRIPPEAGEDQQQARSIFPTDEKMRQIEEEGG